MHCRNSRSTLKVQNFQDHGKASVSQQLSIVVVSAVIYSIVYNELMTFAADDYNEYVIDLYKTSKSSDSNGGQAPVLWTYLLQLSPCRFFSLD